MFGFPVNVVDSANASFSDNARLCSIKNTRLFLINFPVILTHTRAEVARLEGFEPPTPGSEDQCSIR